VYGGHVVCFEVLLEPRAQDSVDSLIRLLGRNVELAIEGLTETLELPVSVGLIRNSCLSYGFEEELGELRLCENLERVWLLPLE
jgi:hypothetical protein